MLADSRLPSPVSFLEAVHVCGGHPQRQRLSWWWWWWWREWQGRRSSARTYVFSLPDLLGTGWNGQWPVMPPSSKEWRWCQSVRRPFGLYSVGREQGRPRADEPYPFRFLAVWWW